MNHRKHYSIFDKEKIVAFIALIIILILIGFCIGTYCHGESELTKCWIMCKPGDYINVRRTPSTNSEIVGYLDPCDWFMTDLTSSNGFFRVYGIGEYGEGWVYCGYVTAEEPEQIFERYVCCAKTRVACRRWMNGPKVSSYPWLTNLSEVDVFYIADGWACTNRGFIMAEYLEVSPR